MKNKGYTLAELLVSIAIFSVVMIGIITIMSNTMHAYNISSTDAELQEEAQIVGNQLEEYLSDAENFHSSIIYNTDPEHLGEVLSASYTFESNGENIDLTYYNTTGELKVNNVIIADNVNSFDLSGYDESFDNKVVIDFSIGDDYKYDFSRAVYLRNSPENIDINSIKASISEMGLDTDPDNTNSDIIEYSVRRFEDVNLTSQFGITKLNGPDGTVGGVFDNGTASAEYFTISSPTDLGSSCLILNTTSDVNANMGLTGPEIWGDTHTITLIGYKSNNQKVTLKLNVDKVEIAEGLCQLSKEKPNNRGVHNFATVKGINAYYALKQKTATDPYCTETCKLTVVKGKGPTAVAQTGSNTFTFSTYTKNGVDTLYDKDDKKQQFNFNLSTSEIGGRVLLFAVPDPYTGNIVYCNGNEGANTCSGIYNKKNFYLKMEYTITYKNATGGTIATYTTTAYQLIDVLGTGLDLD